jgi:hypothetical protein
MAPTRLKGGILPSTGRDRGDRGDGNRVIAAETSGSVGTFEAALLGSGAMRAARTVREAPPSGTQCSIVSAKARAKRTARAVASDLS